MLNLQDQTAAWGQQVDPNQWAYYNYGYDPYGYAAAQDPYAYGAYAGYGQYPPQVNIMEHKQWVSRLLFFSWELWRLLASIILFQIN